MTVRIPSDFAIIIRRESIQRVGGEVEILRLLEESEAFDSNTDLLTIGPIFGQEAADEMTSRLKKSGLKYVDDFFVLNGEFPEWMNLAASLRKDS